MRTTDYTILSERLVAYTEAQRRLNEEFAHLAAGLVGTQYDVRMSYGLHSCVIRYRNDVVGYLTFAQIGENPHMSLQRVRDMVDHHRAEKRGKNNDG